MQPLSDNELDDLLHQWQAPDAPARLQPPRMHRPWWRRTISIPVPVAVLILVFVAYWAIIAHRQPPQTVTLADFQPVKQLQPRIIRSGYEGQ
jgi:hypothetical protein